MERIYNVSYGIYSEILVPQEKPLQSVCDVMFETLDEDDDMIFESFEVYAALKDFLTPLLGLR